MLRKLPFSCLAVPPTIRPGPGSSAPSGMMEKTIKDALHPWLSSLERGVLPFPGACRKASWVHCMHTSAPHHVHRQTLSSVARNALRGRFTARCHAWRPACSRPPLSLCSGTPLPPRKFSLCLQESFAGIASHRGLKTKKTRSSAGGGGGDAAAFAVGP